MKDEPFRDRLLIDKNNLDGELIEQPQVFFDVSHEFSMAVSRRDKAKEEIARTAAKVSQNIRRNALDKGEKITETAISQLVDLDDSYQETVDEHIELVAKASDAQAMKEAFQQRSYVLKDLVNLYLAQYYSSDSVKSVRGQIATAEHAGNRVKINDQRKRAAILKDED